MIQTHLTVDGGEQWLSWAYGRVRALRALDLPFMTKRYVMGDGSTVTVRLTPEATYIELKGTTGGYGVVVLSDNYYDPPEFSVLSDIRQRDAQPPVAPYKRTDNKHKSTNVTYWVGGNDRTKPKISHIDLDYGKYVIDGKAAVQWGGADPLVKVAWIADSQMWVYITVAPDMKSYSMAGVSPVTGVMGTIGTLDVGADGNIRQDDFGQVDISPDGKKIMFVWSEEDPVLHFRRKRFVREYAIISLPDVSPILSTSPTDKNVTSGTVSDTRDDFGYGTRITEQNVFFGYSWTGVLRYATVRSTDTFVRAALGEEVPIDPNSLRAVPGTYPITGGSDATKRELIVGGSPVRTATGASSHSGTATIVDEVIFPDPINGDVIVNVTSEVTYAASSASTSFGLLFFDPRSGAHAVVDGSAESTTTAVTTQANYASSPVGSISTTTTVGPRRVTLYFDGKEKSWELIPANTRTETFPLTIHTGVGPFPPYPDTGVTSPGGETYFASRRPGEGVFAFNPIVAGDKKFFAVIGQKNGVADFLSEDKSGLKTFGKAGLRVTQVYPI